MKREEQVLLYQFQDGEKLEAIRKVLRELHVKSQVLSEDAHNQKVGYLLGMKGFRQKEEQGEGFSFPHEVMVFHNIRGKRLDEVLGRMREAGIPPVVYKAVVTPFNTLWTLGRLCRTMEREHGATSPSDEKKE